MLKHRTGKTCTRTNVFDWNYRERWRAAGAIWKVNSLCSCNRIWKRKTTRITVKDLLGLSVCIRTCHRQYEPGSQQLLSCEFGEAYKNVLICPDIPFGHETCKYGTADILHLPKCVEVFLRGWSSIDSFKTRSGSRLYLGNSWPVNKFDERSSNFAECRILQGVLVTNTRSGNVIHRRSTDVSCQFVEVFYNCIWISRNY